MKTILIIIAIVIANNTEAQKGNLSGRILDSNQKIPVSGAIVRVKPFNKTTISDNNGNFRIDSLPAGKYEIEISSIGYPLKSFNVEIKKDSTCFIGAVISGYCKYDASKNDMTCPVCHRKNKVIPIVYGLPVGPMDTAKYYYAGCETTYCDPHWYCKRDKIKF
jgi:hypothetical protein